MYFKSADLKDRCHYWDLKYLYWDFDNENFLQCVSSFLMTSQLLICYSLLHYLIDGSLQELIGSSDMEEGPEAAEVDRFLFFLSLSAISTSECQTGSTSSSLFWSLRKETKTAQEICNRFVKDTFQHETSIYLSFPIMFIFSPLLLKWDHFTVLSTICLI